MLAELALSWMVRLQPPEVSPARAVYYGVEAASFANAAEENPVFGDAEHTLAILDSLAFFESGYDPHAMGDCDKDKNGKPILTIRTCRSFGLFQISKDHAPIEDLFDVEKAPVIALKLLAQSKRVCRGRPAAEALGWFAAGGNGCFGLAASRQRYGLAQRLIRELKAR